MTNTYTVQQLRDMAFSDFDAMRRDLVGRGNPERAIAVGLHGMLALQLAEMMKDDLVTVSQPPAPPETTS